MEASVVECSPLRPPRPFHTSYGKLRHQLSVQRSIILKQISPRFLLHDPKNGQIHTCARPR